MNSELNIEELEAKAVAAKAAFENHSSSPELVAAISARDDARAEKEEAENEDAETRFSLAQKCICADREAIAAQQEHEHARNILEGHVKSAERWLVIAKRRELLVSPEVLEFLKAAFSQARPEIKAPLPEADLCNTMARDYIQHATAVLLYHGTPISVTNILHAFPQDGTGPALLHAFSFGRQDDRMAAAAEYFWINIRNADPQTLESILSAVREHLLA